MPIKSKAQRRKFAELLVEGKISPDTFEEWNRGAGDKALPERLHPQQKKAKKRTAKRKPTAKAAKKPVRKTTKTRKVAKRR